MSISSTAEICSYELRVLTEEQVGERSVCTRVWDKYVDGLSNQQWYFYANYTSCVNFVKNYPFTFVTEDRKYVSNHRIIISRMRMKYYAKIRSHFTKNQNHITLCSYTLSGKRVNDMLKSLINNCGHLKILELSQIHITSKQFSTILLSASHLSTLNLLYSNISGPAPNFSTSPHKSRLNMLKMDWTQSPQKPFEILLNPFYFDTILSNLLQCCFGSSVIKVWILGAGLPRYRCEKLTQKFCKGGLGISFSEDF
ncbi:unnamed protein product [Moneuplotes crassus]|uniref:Uncharacterized protein n=1 Tax=Euplotes crassus TaxID=5936 RepID=A0AAD2D4M5_EUPCR|nr:unnamed protein product [Moneuplotes crassus]